ncbi:MAG: hypothetical protein ACFB10_15520 [Salibacteraceae bacterium]
MQNFKFFTRFIPALALVLSLMAATHVQAQTTLNFTIENTTANPYPQVLFKLCDVNNPSDCYIADPSDISPTSVVNPGANNYTINNVPPGFEVSAIIVIDGSGGSNNGVVGICPGLSTTDDVGYAFGPPTNLIWINRNFACIYDGE